MCLGEVRTGDGLKHWHVFGFVVILEGGGGECGFAVDVVEDGERHLVRW